MSGRVIVVGSVNVDLVVRAPRLPAPGETVIGGTFERHHGGKGGNQAVAASRLGVRTAFVGAVGDDDFGSAARTALEHEGVDVAALRTVHGQPTGVALVLVDDAGENLISVASGANAALEPADVRKALASLRLARGDVLLVSSEIPRPSVREALRGARATGALGILNPAPAPGLDRGIFGMSDVLTPNRAELASLVTEEGDRTGRPFAADYDPVRAAEGLLATSAEGAGVGLAVVLTLGRAGGLLVRVDGPALDLPAPAVSSVDATGAGDAFNGALAAGLAEGRTLPDAARRAIQAASLSTTIAGAREGMPSAEQLKAFARRAHN